MRSSHIVVAIICTVLTGTVSAQSTVEPYDQVLLDEIEGGRAFGPRQSYASISGSLYRQFVSLENSNAIDTNETSVSPMFGIGGGWNFPLYNFTPQFGIGTTTDLQIGYAFGAMAYGEAAQFLFIRYGLGHRGDSREPLGFGLGFGVRAGAMTTQFWGSSITDSKGDYYYLPEGVVYAFPAYAIEFHVNGVGVKFSANLADFSSLVQIDKELHETYTITYDNFAVSVLYSF